MAATGKLKYTTKRSKIWRDLGKTSTKQSSTEKHSSGTSAGGSPSLGLNPLENPECFSARVHCRNCKIEFGISLEENFSEPRLCNKCEKEYLEKQELLKKSGLPTDIEIQEIADKRYSEWFCKMGFIDGYIEMRDGERNILSKLS